jgi:hypothetical protein
MLSTRSILVALAAACGLLVVLAPAAPAADAKASGTVTFKGKPLLAGKVTFYLDNGQFVGSKVKDGKYTVDRIPVGTWKVAVEGTGVPRAYAAEETSPLKVEVKEGPATFDFDLK